jgi:hypothetical protein
MKAALLVLAILVIALYPRESEGFTAGIGNVGKRQLKVWFNCNTGVNIVYRFPI